MDSKYVIIYDTETTGLSRQNDWIIQLSALKVDKERMDVIETFNEFILPPGKYEMSPGALETHHISPEFLAAHGRPMAEVGKEFIEFVGDSDLCGFNSNQFDVEFCYKDFAYAGLVFPFENRHHFDVRAIELRLRPNTLVALYERYVGKSMEESNLLAHNALGDAYATLAVLVRQMGQNQLTWDDLSTWDENNMVTPDGTIRRANGPGEPELLVFNVGKYRDKDIAWVIENDINYMKWAKDKLFSAYTTRAIYRYYKEYTSNKQK